MENKTAVIALSAIAQESRLTIFRLLVQAGEQGLSAGKISEATGIPPSSLSFHLKEMTHAHMLLAEHKGRFIMYSVNFDCINQLINFLTDSCCSGQPCALNASLSDKC